MPSCQFIKSALAAIAVVFAFISHALAGDQSQLNVLGFSDDGAIFAFEEYGIQDGSGFAYANRFYIDTATDTFIGQTPIRVQMDSETQTLDTARNMARQRAEEIVALPKDGSLQPAFMAGFNAITERSADPYTISVNPRPVVPPIDPSLDIRLAERTLPPPPNCAGFQEVTQGFRLVQLGSETGQTARLLHEDTTVPASRKCPLGYRIGGIFTYFPDSGENPVFAVMIAIRSIGFEGPDYRWMAVTAQFE